MAVMAQTLQPIGKQIGGDRLPILDPSQNQLHGTRKHKIEDMVQIFTGIIRKLLLPSVNNVAPIHSYDSFQEFRIAVFAPDGPGNLWVLQNVGKQCRYVAGFVAMLEVGIKKERAFVNKTVIRSP